ncbi:hypothetical protein T01_11657 [Trichinella spiralis]|uniref:Uncharacterized protein n=1 Tax=Trichinella spiralis TaxID=6334 RepID=A0A0V1BS42_TRISP|nr:hypothetical protein T01_11657 [Trichinella spiralis]
MEEEEEETGESCLQSFKYCEQTSVYPLFTLLHQSHCHVSVEPLVVVKANSCSVISVTLQNSFEVHSQCNFVWCCIFGDPGSEKDCIVAEEALCTLE